MALTDLSRASTDIADLGSLYRKHYDDDDAADVALYRLKCCENMVSENRYSSITTVATTSTVDEAASGLLRRGDGDDGGGSSWGFFDVRFTNPLSKRPLLHGLRGWRGHQTSAHVAAVPATRAGGPFQEFALRPHAASPCDDGSGEPLQESSLLMDSVLLLPALLQPSECAEMRAAADRWCDADSWTGVALRRIQCHVDGVNLDGRAHALADLILCRALWNLEQQCPELCAELFPLGRPNGRPLHDLGDCSFKFSGSEPMINRYTDGGAFDPHQDGHALTVLVPLSSPSVHFEGSGTAFWSAATIGDDPMAASASPPTLVLCPPAGDALFWRGHITHAGLPVTSGMRHVFVASFNLRPPKNT